MVKFLRDEWRLIVHIGLALIVLPLGLWRVTSWMGWLSVPPLFLMFAGAALWIAFFVLGLYVDYLVRGYSIYQDHAENIVYKERGKGSLNFYVTLRRKFDIYEGVDIHVNSEQTWDAKMPIWAQERRKVILQRLKGNFQERDQAQFVEDA